MQLNKSYLIPGAGPGLSVMDAHKDLFNNMSKNKNPGFAMNPFQRGSIARAMDSFTPHGMIMNGLGLGKGGGEAGSAYANGEFDIASYNARKQLTDFLRNGAAQQRSDFNDSVQRGIQNRTNTKLMENAREIGPNLKATNVKGVPSFLGQSGGLVSGANRGTDHGAALEGAISEGKDSTPEIANTLGAKGTSRGLANEAIPKFKIQTNTNLLPDAQALHAGAQMQAESMNKPKGK